MAEKRELLLIEIREDGARVVKRHIDDLGTSGDRTANQMDKLKTVLAGLISAKVIKDTIMLANTYANMLNRLRVVTSGQYELKTAMEEVYKMSRNTRTALETNIEMYARIAINTRQMGIGLRENVKFATQLNHAIILSGVTAREAQWGMVQFSQGLASNALRGDELRAVLEQLPVVTDVIAKHFNVTRGEIRHLGFQGRITSKEIIKAFNEAEKELRERFEKRIPTIDQGLVTLHNSFTKFIGDLDQAYTFTGNLSKVLLYLADHMDSFGRYLLIAGGLLGTVYLKNLIGIVSEMRLFNLALLRSHKLMTIFGLAAVGIIVYADKIKIADDSTATLADTFTVLGERAKESYGIIKKGMAQAFSGTNIPDFKITYESIMTDLGRFIDHFLGAFVGAGQVIKKIFFDIPRYAKQAWNGVLSGVETVKDVIVAVFKAIGDSFKIFGLNMKVAMISLSASMKQMLAGNIEEAARFADQAALSLKNAATQGFGNIGDLFRQNLERATQEDSLAGAKFNVEQAGETLGQAFMRGFNMSDTISGGLIEIFNQAKINAAARNQGSLPETTPIWSPTPIQSQLIKDMSGNAGELRNKMQQLAEMWDVISERAEDKQLFDFEMYSRKMTELRAKSMETSTGVVDGFQRGFMKLTLEMSNFADQAERTIVGAFSRMEDALVQFVTTGKVDFKGLVDSILGDLTRMLARQAMMALFNTLAPGGASAGGILGTFASGGAAATGGSTPARALGGPVSPGMSYMVGERRPEIFTPAQPGHVSSNPATVAQGAPPNVVIINVASEEEAKAAAAAYINSSEGDRVIQNKIKTSQSGR